MHLPSPSTLLPLLLLPPTITAWGSLGHRATTAVALLHFPQSNHPVHTLLANLLHNQDPPTASLFPDKIRYIPKFAYTAPWHYIDSTSVPPETCSLNLTRDCPVDSGCVVSAIANHTARVADTSLPLWERGQSLRFMLHFFGDTHMPLHTVGWERGGNEVSVVFDGVHTSLHSVWDTLVARKIVKLAGDAVAGLEISGQTWDPTNETEAALVWSRFLYSRYHSDPRYAEVTPDSCVCTHDATECALSWAREANGWVCEYILKDGVEGVQGQDLGGEYFEGAVPIVEGLVFKGGRRLARWLEVVAEAALVGGLVQMERDGEL